MHGHEMGRVTIIACYDGTDHMSASDSRFME
ncbi:hypothetical protein ACVWYH_007818 [Bradyrhizobium sp. GM24.11]